MEGGGTRGEKGTVGEEGVTSTAGVTATAEVEVVGAEGEEARGWGLPFNTWGGFLRLHVVRPFIAGSLPPLAFLVFQSAFAPAGGALVCWRLAPRARAPAQGPTQLHRGHGASVPPRLAPVEAVRAKGGGGGGVG